MASTPFVAQLEVVECGAACLTMALHAHGCFVPLSDVRAQMGVGRDGVTALDIVKTARQYGMKASARMLSPEQLGEVEGVAILHWELNHFVVLESWRPDRIEILDPAIGRRRISPEDFRKSFNGICILLSPTEALEPRPPPPSVVLRQLGRLLSKGDALGLLAATSLMTSVLALTVPLVTQLFVTHVVQGQQLGWVHVIGVASIAILSFRLIVEVTRAWVVNRLRRLLDAELGLELVEKLAALPLRFFAQRHAAELMSRVLSVQALRDLVSGATITALVDAMLLSVYLLLLLAFDWRLGTVALLVCALYAATLVRYVPHQRLRYREKLVKEIKMQSELLQIARGIKTLKSSGREETAYGRWRAKLMDSLNISLGIARLEDGIRVWLEGLAIAAHAVCLVLGTWLVLHGELGLGDLFAFLLLLMGVLTPLGGLVEVGLRLAELPTQLERIDDIAVAEPERTGGEDPGRLMGDVALEGVSFRYSANAKPVLKDVTLRIHAGEKVALVGPSGAGKSTLARLLVGLAMPTEGTVRFDGRDLSELDLASVRAQVGVVLQRTHIFAGTVRENIALYHPKATLEEIVDAARAAQLHTELERLPRGYDTRIEPSAMPLSGGQLQRLALARAILPRPAILLLDEASSALDAATEAAVEQYLNERRCTRIVIAHRFTTIRSADRIFVFDGGALVEDGRHQRLASAGGLYARLWAAEAATKGATREAEEARFEPTTVSADELGAMAPLAKMSELARETCARWMTRRSLAGGTTLIAQGERAVGLYVVARGALDAVVREPGLAPLTIGTIEAGETLGELGLFDGSPASVAVEAHGAVEVLHLSTARFRELTEARGEAGRELLHALAALLGDRLQRTERGEAEALAGRPERRDPARPGSVSVVQTGGASLRELGFTSDLDEQTLASLEAMGSMRTLGPGMLVVDPEAPWKRITVVVRGELVVSGPHAGRRRRLLPGDVIGASGLFGKALPRWPVLSESRVALFEVDAESLDAGLRRGEPAAWHLLGRALSALAVDVRLANARLREAVALAGGELDEAHESRLRARGAVASEQLELLAAAAGAGVAVVREDDPSRSAVACLHALLLGAGRIVTRDAVAEACGTGADGLMAGARSLGLLLRPLAVEADDLRAFRRPLILELQGGLHVVAAKRRGAWCELMDPLRGRRRVLVAELAEQLDGLAYEARSLDVSARPLSTRLLDALGEHRGTIAYVGAAVLLAQVVTLAPALLLGMLVDRVIPTGSLPLLGVLAGALGATVIGRAALTAARDTALRYVRAQVEADVLEGLLDHTLSLPLRFFEGMGAGELLQRFQSFDAVRRILASKGIALLVEIPVLLVAVAYLALLDGSLFAVIAAVFVLSAAVAVGPTWRQLAAGRAAALASADHQARLLELLDGISILRLAGAVPIALRRWAVPYLEEVTERANADHRSTVQRAALSLLDRGGVALVTYLGVLEVLAGDLALGQLMAFTAIAGTTLAAVRNALEQAPAMTELRVSLDRTRDLLEAEAEQDPTSARPPGRLGGRVTVEGVSFAYDDGAPVLSDVSLEVPAGAKVCIVGASGAGKSTLGGVLLGLLEPSRGSIRFDGRDLAGLNLVEVRRQIGVVEQETFLMAGSIRSSIALTAPGASLEDVRAAAAAAAIDEDVMAMPMQYETIIGDGGGGLSGGQRQRVALARALVSKPRILLLDEATSALDNLSQRAVERAMGEIGCTRIVIAHRLSTVVDADLIVVMHGGRVVESGTHAELLDRGGAYARLMAVQLDIA